MSIGTSFRRPLADKFGPCYCFTFVFYIYHFVWFLPIQLKDLMIYRFITGVGPGAAMPNISTIVSEYMPVKRKAFSYRSCWLWDLCWVFLVVVCCQLIY